MFEYKVNQNGEIAITDYEGNDTEVIIPPEIDGKPVTSIGDCAFEGCTGLISVEIPNSVTSIGGYAFYNCRNLMSITIPNSVTSIEMYTFCGCSSLKEIYYSDTEEQWQQIKIGFDNLALNNAKKHFKNVKHF